MLASNSLTNFENEVLAITGNGNAYRCFEKNCEIMAIKLKPAKIDAIFVVLIAFCILCLFVHPNTNS